MRSLLFHHELKAKRVKKIKSKTYHRLLKKDRLKGTAAAVEMDPEAARELAMKQEFKRAEERLTLKDKNSNKWAKRILKRGLSAQDEGTRAAIAEQLHQHSLLTRKMNSMKESTDDSSDEDESDEASDQDGPSILLNKAKEKTLEVLGGDEEMPKSEVLSLPFMARGLKKRKEAADEEARLALEDYELSLKQLEGKNEEESKDSKVSSGRMAFGTETEVIEQRLKSFMGQLKTEFGILDRIVYKNKNQHRRSSYFQFLLKVRRDSRLLQSANLDEILSSCFLVINGNRPKQKVQLLESLKWRRGDGGKYNFLERLLGVARLLSQMVEPMLKAAVETSKLLAQSFFMGLSLTVLALLARFRVLIQQILLDVVCVYNAVSSLSQKKQAVKISEGGVQLLFPYHSIYLQVFREYYPIKDLPSIHLKCIWITDKYILVEKINGGQTESQSMEIGEAVPLGASNVRYESIEVLLRDNESGTVAPNRALEGAEDGKPGSGLLANPLPQCNEGKKVKESSPAAESLPLSPSCSTATEGGSVETSSSSLQPNNPLKCKHPPKGKVAFVSIKVAAAATSGADKLNSSSSIKGTEKVDEKKEGGDPFFSMLTAGNMNKSSIL